jgi:hypothetical protein
MSSTDNVIEAANIRSKFSHLIHSLKTNFNSFLSLMRGSFSRLINLNARRNFSCRCRRILRNNLFNMRTRLWVHFALSSLARPLRQARRMIFASYYSANTVYYLHSLFPYVSAHTFCKEKAKAETSAGFQEGLVFNYFMRCKPFSLCSYSRVHHPPFPIHTHAYPCAYICYKERDFVLGWRVDRRRHSFRISLLWPKGSQVTNNGF